MRLYPGKTASPPAPQKWSLAFEPHREGSAAQCVGVLSKDGIVRCRLSIFRDDMDEDAVRRAIAEKARAWILRHPEGDVGGPAID